MRKEGSGLGRSGASFGASLALLVCLTSASWSAEDRVIERYSVNAQVRGTIQKAFEDLGTVGVVYRRTGPDAFVLTLAGKVRDPDESSTVYRFSAEVAIRRDGRRLTSSARSAFSEDAEEYRDRVLELAPFICILREEPFPPGNSGESEFDTNGKPYRVRWAQGERGVEATLYEGLRTVGKFFFTSGPASGAAPNRYEKFRVNTERRTVLSFVRR